jgi:hypothetical protein
MTETKKLSRKDKKKAKREASGYVPKKKPRKVSETQKLRRKENLKEKKKVAAQKREVKMVEHLVQNGWTRSGLKNEVWTLGAWKDGFEDCKTTLCRAYRIQLKLDSEGYERPQGMDDDLMGNL